MYTVQAFAELTGISEHTLRYYERVGLLDPVGRAANGHRRYGDEDLERVQFLIKMRATGMPIRTMVAYIQGDTATRLQIMLAHREKVLAQLEAIQQSYDLIEWKIERYQRQLLGQLLEEHCEKKG